MQSLWQCYFFRIFWNNECIPILKGTVEIPIRYCYLIESETPHAIESKNKNEDVIIMAKGYDGLLYRLRLTQVKSETEFIPFSSDEFLQGTSSDKDLTEPVNGNT